MMNSLNQTMLFKFMFNCKNERYCGNSSLLETILQNEVYHQALFHAGKTQNAKEERHNSQFTDKLT